MFMTLWHDFLYQPLFNALIWIYNNWTDANLGWAVVYLTIMLRLFLLPLSLVSEKNRVRNEELSLEISRLEKEFATDPVLRKQEIRRLLRSRKTTPWAKILVLGIQLLVLILLYQVFLRGITGEKILSILYPSVDFPGPIHTKFFGFELGERYGFIWPGIVTLLFMAEIYVDLRRKTTGLTRSDLWYFLLFPGAIFLVLWMLPMVKSLFLAVSFICSFGVAFLAKFLFKTAKQMVGTLPQKH